ncbi:MAG: outer membrane protein assembly factor BamA [Candidatus Babeliales bacterium]|jgi:outer membrane protein insertion porin family
MIVKSKKILSLVFSISSLFFLASNFVFIKAESKQDLSGHSQIDQDMPISDDLAELNSVEQKPKMVINQIIVRGNKNVGTPVILNRIPYKVGDVFDTVKSADAINNLCDLGYFRQVQLEGEQLSPESMNLVVILEEKKLIEKIEFKGNKAVTTKKLREDLNVDKISTIDEISAQKLIKEIKKAYQEENRHKLHIDFELIPSKDNADKVVLLFKINEGPKSLVKRVYFSGNKDIPDRKLRKAIFTREDWLLSFSDGAGAYAEDAVEIDKHRIEYFYRDNGYLQTKVYKSKVDFSRNEKDVTVTFYIKEGPQFIVRDIRAPGDEIYGEDELMPLVSLESGKPFSQAKLVDSINLIRELWGKKGYIYADVYPQIKPDEEKNVVDITFNVERGNRMYVNKIDITGNKYTHDKVIRRQLDVDEGDLITSRNMRISKNQVEYLGYFERGGVDWKIHRITDDLADLEMMVQEAKTGHANVALSYGSDKITPQPSLHGSINVEKNNLFGLGYDTSAMVQASRHHLQRLEGSFSDSHIFDTNISGFVNPYWHWMEFSQWGGSVNHTPIQKIAGFNLRLGFPLTKIDKRLQMVVDLGYEHIRNNNPEATSVLVKPIVDRTFQAGDLTWIGLDFVKDTRNHKVYPSDGYKIILSTKLAPTTINNNFGFFKAELDASWYYALIGQDSLVLAMRARGGRVGSLDNRTIPYKELYQMGGQDTVRGFLWGGVGPAWRPSDAPLGARNAVLFGTELIFPLIADYSMKGHVFYDAGCGWSTPPIALTNEKGEPLLSPKNIPLNAKDYITRNKFDLRHSIGFGVNLVNPFPAKIDWGFKLDRKKNMGESPYEFHLSMNYAW